MRPLGQSSILVSDISFGCVELGIPYGIGVHGHADMLAETDAVRLLQAALDRGINFFDTAPAYGRSEHLLGQAFHDRRSQVVLCTKCPGLRDPSGALLQGRMLREKITGALEASLRQLRTEYVDVYMLHQVDAEILTSMEVAEIFAELRARGMIRLAGASTYPGGLTGIALASGKWPVIQLALNLMDQRERGYLKPARDAGVGIIVRSVLFKGILTDRGRHLHPQLASISQHRERCIEAIPPGHTLSDFATKFVLQLDGVASVLLGIDRFEYLEDALRVAQALPLDTAAMAAADSLAFPDPDFLDLSAWHRNGWLT